MTFRIGDALAGYYLTTAASDNENADYMLASGPWASRARLDNMLTLRVLATLAVVFGHASSFFGAFSWSQFPAIPYIQSQAVTLFFLVSGYTIAWVCDRDAAHGRGISNFIFDRAVRLLVPLVPILLLIGLVEAWIFDAHPYSQNFDLRTLFGNIVFLQNISIPGSTSLIDSFGTNRPLWTISIEFWVYVAFAGSFFAFVSHTRKSALTSICISLLGWCALNGFIVGGRGAGLPLIWLIGALTYWALRGVSIAKFRHLLISTPLFILVGVLLATKLYWPPDGTYSTAYNLIVATAFCLFVSVCPQLPNRWTAAMSWLGTFAYTTYLAHYPVMYWLWYFEVVPRGAFGALAAIVFSLVISYALGQIFERNYKTVRAHLVERNWPSLRSGRLNP